MQQDADPPPCNPAQAPPSPQTSRDGGTAYAHYALLRARSP